MVFSRNFLKFHTKSNGELFLFYFFWLGGLFLIWYEVFHVLPYYISKGSINYQHVHLFVAAWLAINIYGNMYKMVSVDITGRNIISPSGDAPKGWKFCDKCVKNSPERSHHCPLCHECILKRDHHCWFGACCIGYHNNRYYVTMVFYISLASIYANIFNYEFVSDVKGDNGWIMNVLSIIAPHVGWAFGYYSVYDVFIAGLTSVGYILNFLFLWLLIIQIRQISKGQTKYELKKGITTYSIGLKKILREIGGKYWFLVWISPLVPSPLPGDGISFEKFETKEL